ncbi:GxxExxY protein [Pedobacter sp. N23S346]|uniref:GxxExxY protein n=1 Tax=Pedobacter sp. N23S346 TaxID=3402750 RepID=UPI003AD2B806
MREDGHQVIKQAMVPVEYDDLLIDAELRVDLLVDHIIVVELKTFEHLLPIHEAQILTI